MRLRKRALPAKFFADRGTHLAAMVAYFALLSFALGVAASIIAAWTPARAASQLDPAMALHNIETRQRESVLGATRLITGIALVLAGLALIRFAPTFALSKPRQRLK